MYTQLNIPNSQNPFPCDLDAACDVFFQTLAAVQRQKLDQGQIGRTYRDTLDDMNQQWQNLQDLASDGLVERVHIQLDHFMKEYAAQKALYQFLDGAASGWTLTPATPGLQNAMAEKLKRKHSYLSSLLIQILFNERRMREEAQAQSAEHVAKARVQAAEQSIGREFGRNSQLYGLVMQALDKLSEQTGKTPQAIRDAHDDARKSLEDARKSLEIAMSGARQVQNAFPLIMGPAYKLAESANDLVKSNNEHLKQQLPSALESAVMRAEHRKRLSRLFWVAVSLGLMISLPLLAYLLLKFL